MPLPTSKLQKGQTATASDGDVYEWIGAQWMNTRNKRMGKKNIQTELTAQNIPPPNNISSKPKKSRVESVIKNIPTESKKSQVETITKNISPETREMMNSLSNISQFFTTKENTDKIVKNKLMEISVNTKTTVELLKQFIGWSKLEKDKEDDPKSTKNENKTKENRFKKGLSEELNTLRNSPLGGLLTGVGGLLLGGIRKFILPGLMIGGKLLFDSLKNMGGLLFNGLKQILSGVGDKIKNFNVIEKVKNVASKVTDSVREVVDKIKNSNVVENVKNVASKTTGTLSEVVDKIKNSNVIENVKNVASKTTGTLSGMGDTLKNKATDSVRGVGNAIKNSNVVAKAGNVLGETTRTLKNLTPKLATKGLMTGTARVLGKFLGPVGLVATSGYDAYKGFTADKDASFGDKLTNAGSSIINGLTFGLLGSDSEEIAKRAELKKGEIDPLDATINETKKSSSFTSEQRKNQQTITGKIDTTKEKQFLAEKLLEKIKENPTLFRVAFKRGKLEAGRIIPGINEEASKQNVFEIIPNLKETLGNTITNTNSSQRENALSNVNVIKQGDNVTIINNNNISSNDNKTDALANSK